jgi:hypothetical protein
MASVSGGARRRDLLLAGVLVLQLLLAVPGHERLDVERAPAWVVRIGTAFDRVRTTVLSPWRPVQRATGTGQSWGMFAQPDRRPRRLEAWIEVDDRWVRAWSKHDAAMPRALRDRRIRALYDTAPDEGSPSYWAFTRWAGRLVLATHPDATRVRLQLVETHTTDPWTPADPTETVVLDRTHTRAALFAEDP